MRGKERTDIDTETTATGGMLVRWGKNKACIYFRMLKSLIYFLVKLHTPPCPKSRRLQRRSDDNCSSCSYEVRLEREKDRTAGPLRSQEPDKSIELDFQYFLAT